MSLTHPVHNQEAINQRRGGCDPRPKLLQRFCDFYLSCAPRRMVLGHLYEVAREPANYWSDMHRDLIMQRITDLAGDVDVGAPGICQELYL